jgi:cysteine desulfurase/selenocysteine lyase
VIERIYLDNAATSWPKPESVYAAVDHYQRTLGAPAGRGAYAEAVEVERNIKDARNNIAKLINAESAERVVFTYSGTDSLNLAIHGTLRPGDHVISSIVEHNSVLRPLRQLEEQDVTEVTRIPCDATGVINPDDVRKAIRSNTRLIVLLHASNVTGTLQPLEPVGRIARDHGLLFLVDAAQSLGHVPVDVKQLGANLLAAPGHKGLLGPLGTGILYVAPGVEESLMPVRLGGTGSKSDEDRQPDQLPDKYEAGNHNVPGLMGLRAGVAHVQQLGVDKVRQHETSLAKSLISQLTEIDGVRVFGPDDDSERVGVVSLAIDGYDSREVASMLDTSFSIQARAGFHCAPLIHSYLETHDSGGLLRFSPGIFNTQEDIDRAASAIQEFSSSVNNAHGRI